MNREGIGGHRQTVLERPVLERGTRPGRGPAQVYPYVCKGSHLIAQDGSVARLGAGWAPIQSRITPAMTCRVMERRSYTA
jgi:hypothetical protein